MTIKELKGVLNNLPDFLEVVVEDRSTNEVVPAKVVNTFTQIIFYPKRTVQ